MRLILALIFFPVLAHGQETVFALLQTDEKRGDEFFLNRNFKIAGKYYSIAIQRNKASEKIYLKLARTNFYSKNYSAAIEHFNQHVRHSGSLDKDDVILLGESYSTVGHYDKAIEIFRSYLSKHGEDILIMKKIWRLTNVNFLYEDSLHYTVTPIELNTAAGELCATAYRDGVLFLSNRKQLRIIEKLNPSEEPFYKLYYAQIFRDSLVEGKIHHSKLAKAHTGIQSRFHVGPFSLYQNDSRIIYACNQENTNRTLGLAFAQWKENEWSITGQFPFNSSEYSITDPCMSEQGDVLYFASDKSGGVGGKDIYRSELKNGNWTKPVNLGDIINTAGDEVFPYYRDNALYFSSNGHAGLGGLDIFKADLLPEGFDEPKNMGYPVNSTYDDFSIVIDSAYRGGYFSSNRLGKGFNDDIFEFEMDLQTYPVEISGRLRYKEHLVEDTSKIEVLKNAKLYLIDAVRNITVFEGRSDDRGMFALVIPHFSKYKIRVVGSDQQESMVSLEIPKHRKEYSDHDIVVVKDAFKQTPGGQ
jgi:tetratricopeptide (TPR) repeat protein